MSRHITHATIERCRRCGRLIPAGRRPLAALMLHLIKDHHLELPQSWAGQAKQN